MLMYPICGATLNFRWNLFVSFVLDDTEPACFPLADVMAAKIATSNICCSASFLPRLPGYPCGLIVSSKGHRVSKEDHCSLSNPPTLSNWADL